MSPRTRMLARWIWLVTLPCGCALTPPTVGEPGPRVHSPQAEKEYEALLAKYTARAEVYEQLDTRLFTAATYQSGPFREGRVHRVAIFQAQPPPVEQAKLEQEKSELESFHEFFFGVHLNNYRFDDFDRRNSIWRIALISGTTETTPILVQRVGRADLNMRAIYPYMDEFWVAYRIRFARKTSQGEPVVSPGTSTFVLRVASTLGKAEMTFPVE